MKVTVLSIAHYSAPERASLLQAFRASLAHKSNRTALHQIQWKEESTDDCLKHRLSDVIDAVCAIIRSRKIFPQLISH